MPSLNSAALVDYHMHSNLSPDAFDRPEELAQAALGKGLVEIGICEHLDTDPKDAGYERYDEAAVDQALALARTASQGQLRIRKGVEVCYQPCFEETARRLLAKHNQMDYVIGSVHFIDSQVTNGAYMEANGRQETYRRYMGDTLRLIRSGLFDIVGHFEYIRRYDAENGIHYHPEEYGDEISAVLKEIIAQDMTLEVNTSGLRRPGRHTYPCQWTLERFRELGGQAVAVGSDAHHTEHVGAGVGRVLAMLQEMGFLYVVTFRGRHRRWVNIDKYVM
ncbi:MAG: histidinol-phosphatase HisJ family protein [Chloroflexi bacterium]|nr:histidinol-phosphatase HisJ family protein [Chloroflexota bacterium]